ncbi:Glycosyltransferase family 1 protein [Candidatus Electrothrix laxa]
MSNNTLIITGIRGIPARHGGFETFAEHLSRYLVNRNWKVIVYIQEKGKGGLSQSEWYQIQRIHIPIVTAGPFSTVIFDLKSIINSVGYGKSVILTLGYNTAVFNLLYRLKGKYNIINMDGIEWKRQKWGYGAKLWFLLNEQLACWFGNHLVADHPNISERLTKRAACRKISMIPYGAREIIQADESILKEYNLKKYKYAILIARAEPENSILEIVTAFSLRKIDAKLVVLGSYKPDENKYHQLVMAAANCEVIFPGSIYDATTVDALRFFARFYIHGHQVGGTNPSLVEALGAGNAVLAHDNEFNRWVAQDGAIYFHDTFSAASSIQQLFADDSMIEKLQKASRKNFQTNFQLDDILSLYEKILLDGMEDQCNKYST